MKRLISALALALMATAFSALYSFAAEPLSIASFNIKWIGYYTERDNKGLAKLLTDFDIVVIQELVSPPYPGVFPNGDKFKQDKEAKAFFEAMKAQGFEYVLSEEDTGPGGRNHTNSAATEWFVVFFKTAKVCATGSTKNMSGCKTDNLPHGFIAKDRTANPDYERVPYAFGFRVPNGPDFVLISVHLQPNNTSAARERRAHELESIAKWIKGKSAGKEKDFIILGDMNIQNCTELAKIVPKGFTSLNDECRDTATSPAARPYDHVMYRKDVTKEIDGAFDLKVIDLVEKMSDRWDEVGNGTYPGKPYKSKIFPKYFSDHHPIHFRVETGVDDD